MSQDVGAFFVYQDEQLPEQRASCRIFSETAQKQTQTDINNGILKTIFGGPLFSDRS